VSGERVLDAGDEVARSFDARVPIVGSGALRALADATVLEAADVRTALTLARLVGGTDEAVEVAAALAVRAVRLGHVYVDLASVAETASPADEDVGIDLATLPWPATASWPGLVAASPLTAVGPDGPDDRPLRLLGSRLYLDRYYRHERVVIEDLLARARARPPRLDLDVFDEGLERLFPLATRDEHQHLAARTALTHRLSVVAGGPGTGKTTTVARILALLHEQAQAAGEPPPRIGLAAPTGKAAARLGEAIHATARDLAVVPAVRQALLATEPTTIHRLLGWQPGTRSRFRHDATNQLPHSVVIVDESSMVSLSMMARLVSAVRRRTLLVLVGDPRQLASVEAGAVLGDIVGPAGAPGAAPPPSPVRDSVVVLRRVHRFGGGIASLAEAIEEGDADTVVARLRVAADDVRWIEAGDLDPAEAPELADIRLEVVDAAQEVVRAAREGDAGGALDALRAVQVLCAHRRGRAGATRWQFEIERWLRAYIADYGTGRWYAGRPLLVTENDYGLGVFNGDTGVVVDVGDGRLRAVFDRRGEPLAVRPSRLASVDSLYAMTIHKAQGSQFASVVVVLPEPTSPVLTRELLYTAVTRAEQRVTVVGTEEAVRAAVERPIARASGLGEALWAG
jgi:exodeoxyribonuclease V alpha subunit